MPACDIRSSYLLYLAVWLYGDTRDKMLLVCWYSYTWNKAHRGVWLNACV